VSDRDFFDVALAQRACRAFTDEPIDDATVERLLEVATHAPSAENMQPWVFVVVRADDVRAELGELMRRAWEGGGRQASEGRLDRRVLADVDQGLTGGIAAAPVLIVAGADTTRCHRSTVASSLFPALQNLLLAANAMGLGSALTTIAAAHAEELRAIVGFPETVVPVAVVPIGRPARGLGRPRREPVAEHTHRDHYGSRW
jgi:nitroreductase